MQKKKNDVKARTILLLSLPDEPQLRFSKYKTVRQLWVVILKTFSGNEATKKTKKNLLKQQYGNFRAKGSKTLEQTFSRLQKRIGKKISIQGSDVAGFDKSKVECFNCHKMGYFARECKTPISQDRGRRDNFRQGSKAKEQAPKALMAIYGVGWDWSYMANDGEDYALVADEETPTEFALMANTSTESKKLETFKQENEEVDGKLAGLLTASKDLDNLIESQRSDKKKEGLRYSAVPPLPV
nr:hypothetical protein [Tanacetum cinerariifolium]